MKKYQIISNNLLTPSRFFLSLVSIGGIPYSPGTFASFFSIPLIYLFYRYTNISIFSFNIAIVYVISVRLIKNMKEKIFDQQWIVIDEYIGMCVTLIPLFINHKFNLLSVLVGLVLFRLFDIFKPGLIRTIDQLDTPESVLLDDVIAGMISALILYSLLPLL